ncbi:DNA polymerase III subunit gamma and tau [Corynebacterium guangdongense]|uniref:DNA-directed DNA polymerase n=1 Tax=Corynebacterium guangdongense TaxID=1783348 RepID=A0ABU2A2Q0_9CORY|nr:DNA polymerase III subunit gamma and tau [Corynebacterium guangdongense]MDR7330777.1 DNA polymerase-3 subunit gamma/tau [Corynebacterium guangdongense]WJZ16792.1 DNA polymerase III subunit tau [Corynebacterium guangdongense]
MALYRKYRPATFAELIGQEQVTEPLSVALDNGRINHAYLFSGPRGCGKTSSARILARSLNCVEGPTSTPCGVCNSCVSLAPGGPGNLDVTEMDAASHRGVEDMRALRDRAIYAPAESRYRVFIIDEAHMITNEGFNALLKIVEEPPAHLIFIFATTEPDKVIQTIRSRTHHYPFRLLTPQSMKQLVSSVAAEEGALIEEAVYPLLIQAGGGSPRDTLSVLDQLLAGTGPEGLTYEKAVPLLGITDAGLLDATVDALATGDAGRLFTTIDDVIEAGHDPRRFALDLLDHFRDLMILASVPNAFELDLVTAPAGRQEVLKHQAQQFTGGQLANLATTLNDGIGDLRGATSARLLLEVLFGHLLVESRHAPAPVAPSGRDAAASVAQSQAHAAVESAGGSAQNAVPGESAADRWLRQRRESGPASAKTAPPRGTPQAAGPAPARPEQQQEPDMPHQPDFTPAPVQQEPPAQQVQSVDQIVDQASPESRPEPQEPDMRHQPDFTPAPAQQEPPAQQVQQESRDEPGAPQPEPRREPVAPTAGPEELGEKLRTEWATIRREIMQRNRTAGIMLAQAKVLGVRDDTLVLGHNTGVLAERLNTPSNNDDIVAVVNDYVPQPLRVECVIGTDPAAAGFTRSAPTSAAWSPTRSTPREGHAAATGGDDVPDPAEEPERPAEHGSREQSPPAPQPTAPAPAPEPQASAWRSPAALGGEASQSQPPTPPQPEQPPSSRQAPTGQSLNQEPAVPGWQEAARQGTQAAAERAQRQRESPTFGNGVPLPPEPGDMAPPPEEPPYDPAELSQAAPQRPAPQAQPAQPPQQSAVRPEQRASASVPPAALSRDEEEEMMLKQAQEPGQADRRDAMQIAVELLSEELGAKRV